MCIFKNHFIKQVFVKKGIIILKDPNEKSYQQCIFMYVHVKNGNKKIQIKKYFLKMIPKDVVPRRCFPASSFLLEQGKLMHPEKSKKCNPTP